MPQKGELYRHTKSKQRIEVLAVGDYEVLYEVILTKLGKEPRVATFNSCTATIFERDYRLAQKSEKDYA